MELKNFDVSEVKNGAVMVSAEYKMPTVHSTLNLTYAINADGQILMNSVFTPDADAKDVPEMFRFGVQMQMPTTMDISNFYGRGPIENYIDRKSSAFLGQYTQTAEEGKILI